MRIGAFFGAVLLVLLALPSQAVPGAGAQRADVRVGPPPATVGAAYVPNQVLVRYRTGATVAERDAAVQRLGTGARELKAGPRSGYAKVALPSGLTIAEAIQRLKQDPAVVSAAPNPIMRALEAPNDPYFSLQWHLKDPGQGGMNAAAAWDLVTNPGQGVVVAVIDTGVAFEGGSRDSYQFDGSGGCQSRGLITYMQAPDLAGTTFVPGRDFVCTPSGGDATPNDDNSHGTHVAGTIAQATNNGVGVAGVARRASIMPIKVLDTAGTGDLGDLLEAIYWAVDQGARVINMSLGFETTLTLAGLPGLDTALDYAYAHGVTVAAAAGNSGTGTVGYPAAYRTVIAVGATRVDKARASYSNYGVAPDPANNDGPGRAIDVVAPGGETLLDQNGDGYVDGVLQNTFNPFTHNPTDFSYWFNQGTSMAAPHVSGAAAVLLAQNPTWSPDQIRNALQSTALDLGAAGPDPEYGYGLINLHAALGGVSLPTPTLPPGVTPSATATPGATATPAGPTPSLTGTSVPTQVAFDGFESGNGTGGTGWSGGWTLTGGNHTRVTLSGGPQAGAWHLRLQASDASARRTVVVPAGAAYVVRFGAKVSSFQPGDEAYVVINGVPQLTFTSAQSDSVYHTYEVAVPAGSTTILFDAQMANTSRSLYVDNVTITLSGAQPSATATTAPSSPTATAVPQSPTVTPTPTRTSTATITPTSTPSRTATLSPTPVPLSLAATPDSVISGGSLTAIWTGIPAPSPSDWIGLYASGAPDSSNLLVRYTGGAASGQTTFSVPSSVFPGTYELRLFSNNTMVRLATSNSFMVTACPTAALSASPSSVDPGGVVNGAWSGVCFPTSSDWLALHSSGSPDTSYWTWAWSNGSAAGTVPLTVPANAPPGTYELRMYANNTSNRLSVSNSFSVGPPTATATLVLSSTATSLPTSSPTTPPSATPTLEPTATATSLPTSTPTTPPTATATSVPTATPTTPPTDTATSVPTSIPTAPPTATDTSLPTSIPTTPPTETATSLPTSIPTTVPTATPTLEPTVTATGVPSSTPSPTPTSTPTAGVVVSASPLSVISGAPVTAAWSGIPTPSSSDWIGLYPTGAPDNNHIRIQYIGNAIGSGTMAFAVPPSVFPGTYELRLFSNNSMVRLAVSNTFTVTSCPTATLSSAPDPVALGGIVTATWSGVCYPTGSDWIALHEAGTPDTSYRAWIWSGGGASGSAPLTIPTNVPPGAYELRMYANNTSNRIAVGNPFTVTP